MASALSRSASSSLSRWAAEMRRSASERATVADRMAAALVISARLSSSGPTGLAPGGGLAWEGGGRRPLPWPRGKSLPAMPPPSYPVPGGTLATNSTPASGALQGCPPASSPQPEPPVPPGEQVPVRHHVQGTAGVDEPLRHLVHHREAPAERHPRRLEGPGGQGVPAPAQALQELLARQPLISLAAHAGRPQQAAGAHLPEVQDAAVVGEDPGEEEGQVAQAAVDAGALGWPHGLQQAGQAHRVQLAEPAPAPPPRRA